MSHPPNPATKSNFCDRLLILLVVLTCMRVWVGDVVSLPQAEAQVPDSGLQRKQLLDEAQRSNALLAEIIDILKNRTLKVSPATPEEKPNSGTSSSKAKRG